MKARILFFGLAFIAVAYLKAQELKIPLPIDFFQYSNSSGAIYEFPVTRIWGWSRTGKVAYSIEREVAGRGGQKIDFAVFDTVTDEVVLSFGIDTFDLDVNNAASEYAYNLLKNRIFDAIKEHNIIEGTSDFQPFPINKNNMVYNCSVTNFEYSADEFFFNDNISSYTVVVIANGRTKIINTFKSDAMTRGIYICGYILSPFENRALIILAEENFVFEGTEIFYVFAGCHLGIGFN